MVATASLVGVVVGGVGGWDGGVLFPLVVEEGIVGLHVVRGDVERVGIGASGDDGLGGLGQAASEAALVDEGAHVAGAEGAGGQSFGQAAGDLGLAVAGHQALELLDLAFEVDAPSGDFLQVHARFGGEAGDAILAGDRFGPLPLVGGDLLDVSGVLDGPSSVEAAIVAGNLDGVGDDAHGGVAGADHHALADVGGRHRVAVGVEAHARLLADDGRDDRVGVEASSGQGPQPRGASKTVFAVH